MTIMCAESEDERERRRELDHELLKRLGVASWRSVRAAIPVLMHDESFAREWRVVQYSDEMRKDYGDRIEWPMHEVGPRRRTITIELVQGPEPQP